MELDVLIFGGGVAGLWLLDELRRREYAAMLVETNALGAGQTIASQGIIHGGLKYTLSGLMNPSAQAVSDMPQTWRDCINASRLPDLSAARILSPCCYLWRTQSWTSRIGLLGARVGLRTPVAHVDQADRPVALRACAGDVLRVEEPVLDVASVLHALARPHMARILRVKREGGVSFDCSSPGRIVGVELRRADQSGTVTCKPAAVVFAAGGGNAALRTAVGLSSEAMQLRPLHMVLARGALPPLFGHCVDGHKTRVTITSATDSDGRTIWYIGGQVAEDGVRMDTGTLITHTRRELGAVLGGIELSDTEWATLRIDRAEGRHPSGERPDGPVVQQEGNCFTVWPTKLALAPALASHIATRLVAPQGIHEETAGAIADWPRPDVARPPWEDLPWRR